METNLKKLIPIMGVMCLGMTQVHAAYDETTSTSGDASQKKMMMAVPPAATHADTGPSVLISADYTLWTARQAGLAVAVANYYSPASATPTEGSILYPEFKLRSGFKVDLGVYLPHDNWDLQAEYTWFWNHGNDMKSATYAANAISTWNSDPAVGPDTLYYAASSWNNWFNRIDMTMGRSFFAGHYLALRPFMGLLGAWDSQHFDINTKTSSTQVIPNQFRNHQTWWGVGPYAGMDATFTFMSDSWNQWSLFLDAGTALPWSKFMDHGNIYTSSSTTRLSTKGIFYTVAPMVEASLGLRWETWWADGAWKFMIQAAWEEQVWFSHNNFIVPGEGAVGSGNGAYTMQGLTIKAVIAF